MAQFLQHALSSVNIVPQVRQTSDNLSSASTVYAPDQLRALLTTDGQFPATLTPPRSTASAITTGYPAAGQAPFVITTSYPATVIYSDSRPHRTRTTVSNGRNPHSAYKLSCCNTTIDSHRRSHHTSTTTGKGRNHHSASKSPYCYTTSPPHD